MVVLAAPTLSAVGKGSSVQQEGVHRPRDIAIPTFDLLLPHFIRAVHPRIHVLQWDIHILGEHGKGRGEFGCLGFVDL